MGDFTANNNGILMECKAIDVERLFSHPLSYSVDYMLLDRVYDRIKRSYYGSHHTGLAGVYHMGYIYGIRAERKRKAEKKTKQQKRDPMGYNIRQDICRIVGSLNIPILRELYAIVKLAEYEQKKSNKKCRELRRKIKHEIDEESSR